MPKDNHRKDAKKWREWEANWRIVCLTQPERALLLYDIERTLGPTARYGTRSGNLLRALVFELFRNSHQITPQNLQDNLKEELRSYNQKNEGKPLLAEEKLDLMAILNSVMDLSTLTTELIENNITALNTLIPHLDASGETEEDEMKFIKEFKRKLEILRKTYNDYYSEKPSLSPQEKEASPAKENNPLQHPYGAGLFTPPRKTHTKGARLIHPNEEPPKPEALLLSKGRKELFGTPSRRQKPRGPGPTEQRVVPQQLQFP